MNILLRAATIQISVALASQATADDLKVRAQGVIGQAFVQAFVGNCAMNAGNNDLVVRSAKALKFAPLPEEYLPLMAPQDPNAEFQGFLVLEGEGAPYLLGVSRSKLDGRDFDSCVVANPYISTSSVNTAIDDILKLGQPGDDETQMGQRFRAWAADKWMPGSFVTFTDAEAMGLGGASLGMVAPTIK